MTWADRMADQAYERSMEARERHNRYRQLGGPLGIILEPFVLRSRRILLAVESRRRLRNYSPSFVHSLRRALARSTTWWSDPRPARERLVYGAVDFPPMLAQSTWTIGPPPGVLP